MGDEDLRCRVRNNLPGPPNRSDFKHEAACEQQEKHVGDQSWENATSQILPQSLWWGNPSESWPPKNRVHVFEEGRWATGSVDSFACLPL